MANNLNFLQSTREDDFIEYFLFLPLAQFKDLKSEQSILKNTLKQIQNITQKYSEKYLWHRDSFKLAIKTSEDSLLSVDDGTELQPHLYGISHYGDNIEDEWFIVYLLFQITKEINGIVARVVDADGEFLLIEAANYLPKWANPETCENRVYIYEGSLHVIPPMAGSISVNEALVQICESPQSSRGSTNIQNSILNRIKGYPERIVENFHSATLYVPVAVAAILRHKPGLLASVVRAFCNRDPVDGKACRAMKYFPPESRVYCRATFTKCLYAMLSHSKYVPDKRTGWNLPTVNSPQHKSHTLGVKLACGFEILVSQAKPSADVENDKGWHAYLKSVKEKGFFRDLLEHSRDYNDLLNKAKEYYINHRDSMQSAPVLGQEILELTKNLDYNPDEFRKDDCKPDDDDSWLDVSPKDLEEMLQARYGRKQFVPLNGNTDASNFTEKLTTFLDHVSDIQGAEFPEENSPIRPPRGLKRGSKTKVSFSSDTKVVEKPNSNKVNFDPAAFTCALQNILDFMIPDDDNWDLDSDSDMSAYGEDREVNFEENKMKEYMAQMDRELQATTIGDSFQKVEKLEPFDDVETFRPVDIDMNALKNVLESYQSQLGEAGPASNMLGPMGIHLEPSTSRDISK